MRNVILIFCVFISLTTQAQNILSDAIQLSKGLVSIEEAGVEGLGYVYAFSDADGLSDLTPEEYEAILWKYGNAGPLVMTLSDAYRGNPFISEEAGAVIYLPSTLQTFDDKAAAVNWLKKEEEAKVSVGGPVESSGVGGLSVTNLADGLAKFIAKRMKQEMTLAFFDRFKDALTKRPEIGQLFPRTKSILELIDNEIYNFDSYIGVLRQNFIIDLKLLPANAETWFTNSDFVKAEDKRILISAALNVGQRFVDGTNPIDVIHYLATDAQLQDTSLLSAISNEEKRKDFKRLAGSMRLVNLLSNSIVKDSVSVKWYSPQEIADAFRNPATVYIYLGLMYQKNQNVGRIGDVEFKSMLQPLAERTSEAKMLVEDLKMEVRQIGAEGKRIKEAIIRLKTEVSWDSLGVEIFHQALSGFFGILSSGISFQQSFVPGPALKTAKNIEEQVLERQFVEILQNLNELNLNVRRKEYVMGVNNLSMLIKMLTDNKNPYLTSLIKYSNFMANVAEAESSDQVAALIEAFALPPGGSKLKKESKFSVSFNSYAGGTVGWERLQVGSEVRTDNNTVVGFSAPVGIGFNRGFEQYGSFSAFISLIDVGALTAFRVNDSNSNSLPELEWSNIVAPGGHLIYGFGGNLPGAFGVGVQRGPNLRKVTENNIDLVASGWRIMFFLNVDIPLFHLYTK